MFKDWRASILTRVLSLCERIRTFLLNDILDLFAALRVRLIAQHNLLVRLNERQDALAASNTDLRNELAEIRSILQNVAIHSSTPRASKTKRFSMFNSNAAGDKRLTLAQ